MNLKRLTAPERPDLNYALAFAQRPQSDIFLPPSGFDLPGFRFHAFIETKTRSRKENIMMPDFLKAYHLMDLWIQFYR
jgi:hypothetical protein